MQTDITLAGGAGEYMESATVVSWSVAPGASVRKGDVLVVVETAKAATEIEAPCDGVLTEILAGVGSDVEVGRPLGRLGAAASAAAPAQAAVASGAASVSAAPAGPVSSEPRPAAPPRVVASPLARRIAAERGLSLLDLAGTGPGGRIKRRDVEAALAARGDEKTQGPVAAPMPREKRPAAAPVVLIHGFGASAATWSRLLPLLSGQACLTLDLPGHGKQRRGAAGFEDLVGSVMLDLEDTGAAGVHLVGHSLGGAVAAHVAASLAVPVRSLTLIAPAGLGPEIDGAFLDGFGRAGDARSLRPWLDRLVQDRAALPEGFAAAVLRERERFGFGPAQAALARVIFPDGTQTLDIRAPLERLTCPVRVIWGMEDAILPVRHTQALFGAAGVHRLRNIGHMPHIEAPALVARLVAETIRAGG